MIKNKSIRVKISMGFAFVVLLVVTTAIAGYRGIQTVGHSLHVVANEEAPIADMAMEMNLSLMTARDAMGEYRNFTTVLAKTGTEEERKEIVSVIEKSLVDFDEFAQAVLHGKKFDDGSVVIKTDNDELAAKIRQADEVHGQFEAAAKAMIDGGRELLRFKEAANSAMESVEEAAMAVVDDAEKMEESVREHLDAEKEKADNQEALQEVFNTWVPYADGAMELNIHRAEGRIVMEEIAQANDLKAISEFEKELQESIDQFDKIKTALLEGGGLGGAQVVGIADTNLRALVSRMDEDHAKFEKAARAMIAAQKAMIAKSDEVEVAMGKLDKAGGEASSLLEKVEELAAAEMDAARVLGAEASQSASTVLVSISVASVLLGMLIGFMIASAIEKPIRRVAEALKDGGVQVASASGQVSSASQSLAEGASQQAAGVEETASSLEEISAMTNKNAEVAEQADGRMTEARQLIDQGKESMQRLGDAIDEIKNSADKTAKIVVTIDEIASQTNLLALNAAVEAARAGEAGRGFAVVAEEVRNLAKRAGDAAKDTGELIEAAVKNAEHGAKVSEETREALQAVHGRISEVQGNVGSISSASKEQASGIDQINTAVGQMDSITQQNAANAEESAAAAEELSAQAKELQMLVEELMMVVDGAAAGSRQVSPGGAPRSQGTGRRAKATPGPVGDPSPKELIPLDEGDLADF